MEVPGASRCPVGHTPVEHAPGAQGPWALRGWAGAWGAPPGDPALGALGREACPGGGPPWLKGQICPPMAPPWAAVL